MRTIVKIVIALAIGAVATAAPANAAARTHHAVKHHRHPHAHRGATGRPLILVPGEQPRYRYGVPLYSTCDRINADRMLVGTCR